MHNDYLSVQQRPIEVFSYGSGPKTTMLMAGVHGDEKGGVEIIHALHKIVSALPVEALQGHRLVIMPCANPDGFVADTRQNANGVDLNRSFPDKTHGTGNQPRKYFGGDVPASEPETKAIMAIVDHFKPKLIISIHESLACVNYNGACIRMSRKLSKAMGLPVVGDVGYPCPGSMGNYYGFDKRLPVITLELPEEPVNPTEYANILLSALGITATLPNS